MGMSMKIFASFIEQVITPKPSEQPDLFWSHLTGSGVS
jgi:hypothetical protein